MESGVLHPLEGVSFTSSREMFINNDKGGRAGGAARRGRLLRGAGARGAGRLYDAARRGWGGRGGARGSWGITRGGGEEGANLELQANLELHACMWLGLPTPPTQPMSECYRAIFAANGPLVKRAREDPAVSGVADERLAQAIDCIGRSVALRRLRQRRCKDWTRHDCVHCKMLRTLAECQSSMEKELRKRAWKKSMDKEARARVAAAAERRALHMLARTRPRRPSLDHVEHSASINEWLSKLKLQQYESVLVAEGYDELRFLRDADTCDIEELLERLVNEKVMKKPHSKTFMKYWDKLKDLELQSAAKTTCSNPFFSAFAPPEVMPAGPSHGFPVEVAMFAWEYSEKVAADAETREMTRASPNRKGPVPIAHGSLVSVVLDLPEDAFDTDHGATELLQWDGMYSTFQFEVTCLRGAELRKHVCKAIISVAEQRVAILQFELNVVQRKLPSPPVSPPSEVQTQELTVLSRNWRVLQMLSNSSSGSGSGSIRSKDILRSLNRERDIMSRLWGGDQGRLSSQLQNLIPKLMTSYELFVADLREMNLNQSKETHICHLSGHGETRSLVFQGDTERDDENLQEPDPMAFASEVVDNGVKCLVLNCCNSGDLGRAVNRCARKKGKRVVVVCWDSPVVSRACEKVTDTFYRSILQPLASAHEGALAGAAAVDDIFVAAEKAFQAVERTHHAGVLGKHLRDRVVDPLNRFAIARCDYEELWRYSVDSDGQWGWEAIEREPQADDGMEDSPLPDDMVQAEDANPPSDPYLHYTRASALEPQTKQREHEDGGDGCPKDDHLVVVVDDPSTVAKVQAARENRRDRLAQSQPAIEAGGAPSMALDVALQTAPELVDDFACAPSVPDDFDDAPDFDEDF